jgi:hypothetical protein
MDLSSTTLTTRIVPLDIPTVRPSSFRRLDKHQVVRDGLDAKMVVSKSDSDVDKRRDYEQGQVWHSSQHSNPKNSDRQPFAGPKCGRKSNSPILIVAQFQLLDKTQHVLAGSPDSTGLTMDQLCSRWIPNAALDFRSQTLFDTGTDSKMEPFVVYENEMLCWMLRAVGDSQCAQKTSLSRTSQGTSNRAHHPAQLTAWEALVDSISESPPPDDSMQCRFDTPEESIRPASQSSYSSIFSTTGLQNTSSAEPSRPMLIRDDDYLPIRIAMRNSDDVHLATKRLAEIIRLQYYALGSGVYGFDMCPQDELDLVDPETFHYAMIVHRNTRQAHVVKWSYSDSVRCEIQEGGRVFHANMPEYRYDHVQAVDMKRGFRFNSRVPTTSAHNAQSLGPLVCAPPTNTLMIHIASYVLDTRISDQCNDWLLALYHTDEFSDDFCDHPNVIYQDYWATLDDNAPGLDKNEDGGTVVTMGWENYDVSLSAWSLHVSSAPAPTAPFTCRLIGTFDLRADGQIKTLEYCSPEMVVPGNDPKMAAALFAQIASVMWIGGDYFGDHVIQQGAASDDSFGGGGGGYYGSIGDRHCNMNLYVKISNGSTKWCFHCEPTANRRFNLALVKQETLKGTLEANSAVLSSKYPATIPPARAPQQKKNVSKK